MSKFIYQESINVCGLNITDIEEWQSNNTQDAPHMVLYYERQILWKTRNQ